MAFLYECGAQGERKGVPDGPPQAGRTWRDPWLSKPLGSIPRGISEFPSPHSRQKRPVAAPAPRSRNFLCAGPEGIRGVQSRQESLHILRGRGESADARHGPPHVSAHPPGARTERAAASAPRGRGRENPPGARRGDSSARMQMAPWPRLGSSDGKGFLCAHADVARRQGGLIGLTRIPLRACRWRPSLAELRRGLDNSSACMQRSRC